MFGVDKAGRDRLSPQFRKGEKRKEDSDPQASFATERNVAVISTAETLRKDEVLMKKINKKVRRQLEEDEGAFSEDDVQRAVDDEVMRLATEFVQREHQDRGEIASKSGIFRIS
jgi:hypothetical protein